MKKIDRKKLKSSELKFQKQLLSKTVSPSHNKVKRKVNKKQKIPGKYLKNLSPLKHMLLPLPTFPKTAAERVYNQKYTFVPANTQRPKKVSVKNFTKTKSKLTKYNPKKKISVNERNSSKLNRVGEFDKKSNIRILIKNEIINNNNNHYYNLQMQKPFGQQKLDPFEPGAFIYNSDVPAENTPLYSGMPARKHFVYEDFDFSNSTELGVGERKAKDALREKLRKGKTTESKEAKKCNF